MNASELEQLEVDICTLITQTERLRTENTALQEQLDQVTLDRDYLKRTNTKISLKIKQIIRQLKGDTDEQ